MSTEHRLVHSVLAPLVALVASEDADALARANGLPAFVDFVRPFGQRLEGRVNIRDAQGQSSTVDGFSLRFANLFQLEGVNLEAVRRVLVDAVSSCHSTSSTPLSELAAVRTAHLSVLSPWYSLYRDYVCKFNGASEHEAFNHPVACIIVASTMSPDPIGQLSQLYPSSPDQMPSIFNNGFIDPQISLKHYLLIHDASRAPSVDADAIFAQMKKQFGLSCRLIKINTKKEGSDYSASHIWDAYMKEYQPLYTALNSQSPNENAEPQGDFVSRHSVGARTFSEAELNCSVLPITSVPEMSAVGAADGNLFAGESSDTRPTYGSLMSEADVKSLDTFVKEFIVQSLLPSMERSVQHWNEQVASSRRGITGRLFTAGRRYFGTAAPAKTTSGTPAPDSSTPYPHISQELILRKLADYSFMLRDYKFAYSMYDSVKKDFQSNDRATKHFAGVQEMLALCVLMSDANLRGNLESLLDSAITNYLDAGVSIYATRATMLVYEMLKYKENYKDASALLLRMIGEDSDLRSAILLEQSAFCHLKSSPSLKRKYAFYLVMAGDRYTKCGQRRHALRCYRAAQQVYEGQGWSLVDNHNNFTIGRLCFHLGDATEAFSHFLKLFKSSNQSPEQQASHMKEFLHIYKCISAQRTVTELENLPQTPVPVLQQQSIDVSLIQSQHIGQTSANDSVWDKMEIDLVENGFNRPGCARPVKLMKTVRDGANTICAVGEPVFVSFVLENPLQIPLELSNITLAAEFTKSVASAIVTDLTDRSGEDGVRLQNEFFDVEYLPGLVLAPKEVRQMQLKIYPKCEGDLLVQGLKLTLSDCVPITISFNKRGRRLNDTQKQRSEDPVYAADNTLKLTVTAPMPVLDVLFHSFPDVLLSGQVERTVLEVNNKGNRGLKNLKMKLSHVSFFGVGDAEQIDYPSYSSKPIPEMASQEILHITNKISDASIVDISLLGEHETSNGEGVLVSGSTTIIPVWVRGDKIGKHTFRFLFGYQSEDPNDKIGYRKLQYSVFCQVYPSLKINAFTRPSTNVLSEFILGIEVENLQQSEIKLRQFTSISPQWKIKPAADIEQRKDQLNFLKGRQTSFVYFRFEQDGAKAGKMNPSPESTTTEAIANFIINENQPFSPAPIDLTISNVSMRDEQVVCNSIPFSSFAQRSRTIWRNQSLMNQYSGIPSEKVANIFTLYFTDDADIVLFWEAPPLHPGGPPRFGHHFIIGINLSLQSPLQLLARIGKNASNLTFQSRSLYAATVAERKTLIDSLLKPRQKDVSPLRLILESEKSFTHDFSKSGDLILPFSARLRNTSWENRVLFSLELPSNESNAALENDFSWTGATTIAGTLEPEQEISIELHACFARKGTFDVNRWKLNVTVIPSWTGGGGGAVGVADAGATTAHPHGASYVQIPNLPYLVTIH
ncbi:ER-golgi trafficking TRAPP I complex 85 kDa subunit-domain-containing protein [Chytriomyces cf. hyalinus JEL632]|nr:ER-golgi trafficking TRAPP I complex 85 kDa subunit-domain-containing protein [Chytriomyces cf. hyalinus JEL632]